MNCDHTVEFFSEEDGGPGFLGKVSDIKLCERAFSHLAINDPTFRTPFTFCPDCGQRLLPECPETKSGEPPEAVWTESNTNTAPGGSEGHHGNV